MSKRCTINGITWLIDPPYLRKPTNDKNRKDIELKINDDLDTAFNYIAIYLRISVEDVRAAFEDKP